MAISNQTANEIDKEVNWTAMARMFDLRNVFELINDGLNNSAFAKQEFVHQRHENIFHVRTNTCHKLNAECAQEFFRELFGNIAFISEQFAKQLSSHLGNGLTIIYITRCQHQIEQFTLVIDDQM